MKTKSFFILLFFLFLFKINSEDLIKFDWGVFIKESINNETLLKEPFVYNSKDITKFQIRFTNNNKCFFYICYVDSKDKLYLLYPDTNNPKSENKRDRDFTTLPDYNKWFEIDKNQNEEKLYLIVSNKRLDNLIRLSEKYNLKYSEQYKYDIINEIKKLLLENSRYKTIIEAPSLITSDIKSPGNEILKVEKEKLYVKTIIFKSK